MSTKECDDIEDVEEKMENDDGNETGKDIVPETYRILEALLFASDELLTAARIKTILPGNLDARQIRKLVDKINVQLQKERHPFEIVEIGGGYQFRTVAYYHPWVRQIFKEKAAKKLSLQALECLAIISYKQPISKAEIESVRGVVSDGAMKTLLEKKLVTISGRSEKPGRPLQYSTTNEFLKYFGLNKVEDLPRIEEFEAIAREKIDELTIDELSDGKGSLEGNDAIPEGIDTDEIIAAVELADDIPSAPESTAVFEVSQVSVDVQSVGEDEMVGLSTDNTDDFALPPPESTAVFEVQQISENFTGEGENRESEEIAISGDDKPECVVEAVNDSESPVIDDTDDSNVIEVENDFLYAPLNSDDTAMNETVHIRIEPRVESDAEEVLEVDVPVDENQEDLSGEKSGKKHFSKKRKKKTEELEE
jgi:segregation and condensation protein B